MLGYQLLTISERKIRGGESLKWIDWKTAGSTRQVGLEEVDWEKPLITFNKVLWFGELLYLSGTDGVHWLFN